MECPKCSCREIRAAATNSQDATSTVRKRQCVKCSHVWFTVEVPVVTAVVGWERVGTKGASKPVLRVPLHHALDISGT